MAKPNTTFNLDVKDLEIIEDALHSVIAKHSSELMNVNDAKTSDTNRASVEAEMSEMRELLGRLHNQKIGSAQNQVPVTSAVKVSFHIALRRAEMFRN